MFAVYILLAVLILLLMVTIHEFGHYVAGRVLGFKINEFSIGFGPAIFQRVNKRGEKISIRVFPLGGYCAFEGEDDILQDSHNPKEKPKVFEEYENDAQKQETPKPRNYLTFNEQKPWKRIIVLISGALFNILSGIIFSMIFISVAGNSLPIIGEVYDTPNAVALQKGDVITAVDDHKITILNSLSELLADKKENQEFSLTVIRDGVETKISGIKKVKYELDGQKYIGIGIGIGDFKTEKYSFIQSVGYSFPFTLKMAGAILSAFGDIFRGIGLDQLSGPVGTITEMAKIAQASLYNVLILLPLIAVNLGLFNLFPIPALDGSKVVFTLIEWIRGKPINRNIENLIHFIGFVLLIGLIILIDLFKFIK
ncbi:MAG TPA: M50 family metallopeptidase [Clostridia bacterium]